MKEIGMLFSTPMVQAILDGRKTMTRRVVGEDKRGEWTAFNDVRKNSEYGASVPCYLNREISIDDKSRNIMYPKYQPGDILWVRETWADLTGMGFGNHPETGKPWIYAYRADSPKGSESDRIAREYGVKWKSSRFMPKVAARIWLEVVSVRVERLQEITAEDARAEGVGNLFIEDCAYDGKYVDIPWNQEEGLAIHQYARLWDSINAKPKAVLRTVDDKMEIVSYVSYPWDDIQETREYRGKPWVVCGNPWVWVVSFKKVTPCQT